MHFYKLALRAAHDSGTRTQVLRPGIVRLLGKICGPTEGGLVRGTRGGSVAPHQRGGMLRRTRGGSGRPHLGSKFVAVHRGGL